jgi:hypothetical protein
MDGLKQVHAHEITAMSREEVLRTLTTAKGVPEASRRMAELMLAGPVITPEEQERLRGQPMRYSRIAVAVALAYA